MDHIVLKDKREEEKFDERVGSSEYTATLT
jgi:hypothetical protein